MLKFPSTLVYIFVLPITFSFIFGNLSTGGSSSALPRAVIVYQSDELSTAVANLLISNNQYEWINSSREEANDLIADGEAIAAVVIPDGAHLEEQIQHKHTLFEVVVNQKTEAYLPLSQYVTSVANQLYMLAEMLHNGSEGALLDALAIAEEQPKLEIHSEVFVPLEDTKQYSSNTTMSIGFTIMFMMFALSGCAAIIHEERKDYTWQRLTTSAASRSTIIGGYLTSFWLIGWLQFAIMIAVMTIFFHTSWGNIGYLIGFASLIILCIVAYSMMMATLVHSKKQSGALNAIIIVSTCMLGGVYWPLEIVPEFMQKLANVIPQYWMMSGLQNILIGQYDWSVIWQPWVILTAMSVIMLSIALWKLSKEQRA